MRTLIIVAPHFPPSNLAAGHRSRLLARHLPEFNWRPIVVTVRHTFYEEKPDFDLESLVPASLQVERVAAMPTRPVRLVGDLGIRAFVPLLWRILSLLDGSDVDFLYITIPSFYSALLGRVVNALRGVPYGIDYIDPWVHIWPGSGQLLSKPWVSEKLAKFLEPIAVRNAALITGVADDYFKDVLSRNPQVHTTAVTASMPYGGDPADHEKVKELGLGAYLFDPDDGRFHVLYAGAMLPKAFRPLESILATISAEREAYKDVCFHFVGTGRTADDPAGFNVRPIAERYGLWNSIVSEHPARIPYLDTLAHLEAAGAVFILGSTEPHYTPSKVYQAVLARRPIFAVLHRNSTACVVIRETGAGQVLEFDGEEDLSRVRMSFTASFDRFRRFVAAFDPQSVHHDRFQDYTAFASARVLASALDRALENARCEPGL